MYDIPSIIKYETEINPVCLIFCCGKPDQCEVGCDQMDCHLDIQKGISIVNISSYEYGESIYDGIKSWPAEDNTDHTPITKIFYKGKCAATFVGYKTKGDILRAMSVSRSG